MPPMTMTANTTAPTVSAIDGSVTRKAPPITPASAASAVPPPKTSMNTRGTLWPSASTISGCVSAAWITRPMRVRVSISHTATSISTATHHAEGAERRELGAHRAGHRLARSRRGAPGQPQRDAGRSTMVKSGPRSELGRLEVQRLPAPDQLHQFQQ